LPPILTVTRHIHHASTNSRPRFHPRIAIAGRINRVESAGQFDVIRAVMG